MPVHIVNPRHKKSSDVIDVTSRSLNWSRGLSPFVLGPVLLPDGQESRNVENAWQYSKVYKGYVGEDGNPTPEYFKWASDGFRAARADRYPMGKGVRPEYSWWDGKKYGYIEARKKIYVPIYAKAVLQSSAFKRLKEIYEAKKEVWLWDFDGYDYEKERMSLLDVLNSETRKMGHCFVLALLLTPQEEWGRKVGDGSNECDRTGKQEPETAEVLPQVGGRKGLGDGNGVGVDISGSRSLLLLGGRGTLSPDERESKGDSSRSGSASVGRGEEFSKEGIRALILERLFYTLENRTSFSTYHNEGILRGMIWALTGHDPGHLSKTAKILELIGVPYEVIENEDVVIPEEWLAANGVVLRKV